MRGFEIMRIKLIIVNRNENFANNFVDFINEKYRSSFLASVYTDLNALVTTPISNSDIMIIESDFYEIVSENLDLSNITVILFHNGVIKNEHKDMYSISMFEESNVIINYIISVFENENKINFNANTKSIHSILGFMSPIGGIGKTTISLLYAKLFARMKLKVLYISLDYFMDMDYYYKGESKHDLTFLFSTLKDDSNITKDIEELVIKDSEFENLKYIKAFSRYKDRLQIDKYQFDLFFSKLLANDSYNVVIFDLPTDIDAKSEIVLNSLTHLFLLTSNATIENIKFNTLLSYIDELPFYKKLNENEAIITVVNNVKNIEGDDQITSDKKNTIKIDFNSDFQKYNKAGQYISFKLDSDIAMTIQNSIDRYFGDSGDLS